MGNNLEDRIKKWFEQERPPSSDHYLWAMQKIGEMNGLLLESANEMHYLRIVCEEHSAIINFLKATLKDPNTCYCPEPSNESAIGKCRRCRALKNLKKITEPTRLL